MACFVLTPDWGRHVLAQHDSVEHVLTVRHKHTFLHAIIWYTVHKTCVCDGQCFDIRSIKTLGYTIRAGVGPGRSVVLAAWTCTPPMEPRVVESHLAGIIREMFPVVQKYLSSTAVRTGNAG